MSGVHNSEKIFPCRAGEDICPVKFSTSASRKRHEMKQHNLDIRLKRGGPKTSMVPTLTQTTKSNEFDCNADLV